MRVALWPVVLLSLAGVATVAGRKKVRPVIVEELPRSKPHRSTHCHFGNQSYELEDQWRPDLGPPFGVLYCVRCECNAVHRKKRIAAKARCRNIKNDCPKPSCDHPVLLPERCCKTCPGQDYADLEEDLAVKRLEKDEDDNKKDYSVLLTGRGVVPKVQAEGAGRGYLTYHKKNLYYTFHLKGLPRLTQLRFTNEEGSILEEEDITEKILPNDGGSKVCGVWRNVPKVYRKLLQKDRLHVALANSQYSESSMVGGKILKTIPTFSAEVYSSLLLGDIAGSGGIALITPLQNFLHVMVDFNGLFTAKDAHNAMVSLTLHYRATTGLRPVVADATISVPKAHPEHNSGVGKISLTSELQRFLAEGRLEMRLATLDGARILRGLVTVRPICSVFQAVLVSPATSPPSSGFLLLEPNLEGTVDYKVFVSPPSPGAQLILERPALLSGRQAPLVDVKLLPTTDGWNNGTLNSISVLQESLMSEEEELTVSLGSSLHGVLRPRPYTEAFVSRHPLALSSGEPGVGGMAWLAVDRGCRLHYQVFTAGLETHPHLLELLRVPEPRQGRPRSLVLRKLDGDQAQDSADVSLVSAQRGEQLYLLVTSKTSRGRYIEMKGSITEVPAACLREDPPHNDVYPAPDGTARCHYEGQSYEDGAQWKARHDDCLMCSCQRGRVVCDPVLCPSLACDRPTTFPGECCPSCSEEGHRLANGSDSGALRGCLFEGDKLYHLAGTSWHPYIPPFGFSSCALCTCNPTTLTVECTKRACPPLTCSEAESFRDHPLACCKRCPASSVPVKSLPIPAPAHYADQGSPSSAPPPNSCKFHNNIYPNGAEWHPTVQPFGEMKCVNCHCKDGKARCKRKKCPKLTCPEKAHTNTDCCQKCVAQGNETPAVPRRERRRRRKDQPGD